MRWLLVEGGFEHVFDDALAGEVFVVEGAAGGGDGFAVFVVVLKFECFLDQFFGVGEEGDVLVGEEAAHFAFVPDEGEDAVAHELGDAVGGVERPAFETV